MVRITEKDELCRRACELFNETIQDKEVLYQELSFEEFCEMFFKEQEKIHKITVSEENGRAFASGCIDERSGKSFITFVAVDKKERRKGLGKAVLEELEKQIREKGENKTLEISFYNPTAFTWEVPGEKGVTHPNAPGVDMSSGAYLFLKNCGYRDFAMQNSYYLPLSQYEYPQDMAERKEALREKGYTFTIYDKEKHTGMEEMLKALNSAEWERDILGEPPVSEGGRPILVPVQGNRVCGFTGPLAAEESGRGYFAGIAVSPDDRGNGLAKVLFCALCTGLKEIGAGYMTLFTGENNAARNIYEAAGFSIVRSWADMRKEK